MPKVTITFTLPKERREHDDAVHGSDWRSIVYELSLFLRSALKYGHTYKSADEALEAMKLKLWDYCEEYNLDPWSDE